MGETSVIIQDLTPQACRRAFQQQEAPLSMAEISEIIDGMEPEEAVVGMTEALKISRARECKDKERHVAGAHCSC